jgi:molybdenum cofactor cytidylyltransferase
VICGVILAAGGSARLGRPKQLLELDGRPLLQRVLDAAARAALDDIVLVLGHEAAAVEAAVELPPGARVALNPNYQEGQSTSLRAGLDAADPRCSAAVILLGDQPLLPADLITRAVKAYRAGDRPVVRTFFDGIPGHPVVVARSEWPALTNLGGDAGGRQLWTAPDAVARLEVAGPPPVDVDTWDQYHSLTRSAGGTPIAGGDATPPLAEPWRAREEDDQASS